MKEVTYSLKLENRNSESYYKEVQSYTDEVIRRADSSITPIVNEYIHYLKTFQLEEIRENEEYILELLSFGILWKTYASTALKVRFAPFITLARMGEWRKKHQKLKPLIDFSRGILLTMLLLPKSDQEFSSIPSLEQIDRVCLWFESTGEFREQALRFIRWRSYFGTITKERQKNIFVEIAKFTDWFEESSKTTLGKYTVNVEEFVNSKQAFYRWREDRISCTRSRNEYHLNMVGAVLMNRAFKKDYSNTDSTTLLLPGCMRFHPNDECQASKEEKGLKCIGCEPKCRVNQLRITGMKKNYDVYIIPHASDLSLWAPKEGNKRGGIVASACVTTLVEGGWELKRYGVPARCVLLDYSGCKKHWHPTGIMTELNKNELDRVLSKN